MHHSKEIKEVFRELNSNNEGLSQAEAEKRLQEYGLNEIKEAKKISPIKIFLNQFNSVVVYILIAALVISLFIGERIDAIVIGIILILNAVFGFIQEYRAEKSIEALKKLASLKATVIRDGKEKNIDAKLLVPGDILKLETGDKLPADARLFEIINLETQEAALTGESTPVSKELKLLPEKTSLADRINMVFSGTIITNGRGNVLEFFIIAVALAVAAIPEGLPAIVTIGLALGTQRMVKRHALIRKLPSVETLGSTTVICTDKTGTLTKNEMTV